MRNFFLLSCSPVPHCQFDGCRYEIRKWLDDNSEDKYDFCNISVTSPYYKRLLHQSLPSMFPSLTIRTSKKHFIQIVENKETTQDELKQARKHKFENRLNESIGLRKVLETICRHKSVLVGHNLFQDLVFIWSQFFGNLPPMLREFCAVVAETFPTYPPH